MKYHKFISNFAKQDDPELTTKVKQAMIDFNNDHLNVSIDYNDMSVADKKIEEPESLELKTQHTPHIDNLYEDEKVAKIVAYFITSSRDDVQGGEFIFGKLSPPQYRDNFGKPVYANGKDNYPLDANEQGTLIITSALEKIGTNRVVSGTVKLKKFVMAGDNYK